MRVAKWGNSLAVRLPASLVEAMALHEGDEVELIFNSDSEVEVTRNRRKEAALAALSKMRWKLPDDYKFDREEANAR
jgi:antitoxin MazE